MTSDTTETGGTADTPPQTAGKLPYLGLFGLMLGIFLATLDGQIVSIALPTIVGDLGGLDHFTWSVTSYLLTMAAATPIWGKLGDLKGRKGAYMWSVLLFLVGTVLCGLAQDMAQLIAFRAVQGLGAGGLMVGALSVIGVLVPAHERGRVQSMVGVMLPVAFVGGPLLGGFITDVLDWRWVFYVNVPFGVVALFAVARGRTAAEGALRRTDRLPRYGAADHRDPVAHPAGQLGRHPLRLGIGTDRAARRGRCRGRSPHSSGWNSGWRNPSSRRGCSAAVTSPSPRCSASWSVPYWSRSSTTCPSTCSSCRAPPPPSAACRSCP